MGSRQTKGVTNDRTDPDAGDSRRHDAIDAKLDEEAMTAEEIADEVWQSLHKKLFIELLESYAAERVREAQEEIDRLSAALKDQCTAIEKSAIEKARADGYKAGQADMRERAAKMADTCTTGTDRNTVMAIVRGVRSLSIEEKD